MAEKVVVLLALDLVGDGPDAEIVWSARVPSLAGFTAIAASLIELRAQYTAALAEFLGECDLDESLDGAVVHGGVQTTPLLVAA